VKKLTRVVKEIARKKRERKVRRDKNAAEFQKRVKNIDKPSRATTEHQMRNVDPGSNI